MPTIIATPGATNANSYVTVPEADAYNDSRPHADVWENTETLDKARALLLATRLLETRITWKGAPATTVQALQWPRRGLVNRVGVEVSPATIPVDLKDATSELARLLLRTDKTAENAIATLGITSLKAGPTALTFSDKRIGDAVTRMVPEYVLSLIPEWWYERVDLLKPTVPELFIQVP
jgi:hypothetical protein